MTYGGWRQSQALGARIASLLRSREDTANSRISSGFKNDSDFSSEGERDLRRRPQTLRGKRRKHRVVIHSSPFLRCTQTAIAISAGIAQNQDSSEGTSRSTHFIRHPLHSGSPHIQASEHRNSFSHLSAIPEPDTSRLSGPDLRQVSENPRPILRIDAFLGEWLSPDYFDKITPPPPSKLMVAGAKADLLRRGEAIDAVHVSNRTDSAKGNFPGGWGSSTSTSTASQDSGEDKPLADLSSLAENLPKLGRANSHNLSSPKKSPNMTLTNSLNEGSRRLKTKYVPPVPTYAISPSQPIPQGYVAHARDACIKIDYQWDSLRPPHEWGDGGVFGEEWSSMHKRFRRGLQEMLSWYRNHTPLELLEDTDSDSTKADVNGYFDDDHTDTVLILVTHGSGCNALIGALTNQPVLLDVGMASLTLAERKTINYKRVTSPTDSTPPVSPSGRRRSAIDLGLTDDYDIKLIASTDHLRAGSPYLTGSRLQRTATMPNRNNSPYRYERPQFVGNPLPASSDMDENDIHPGPDYATPTGDIDRMGGQSSFSTTPKHSNGGGLWTKPVTMKPNSTLEVESQSVTPHLKEAPARSFQPDGITENYSEVQRKRSNGPIISENDEHGKRDSQDRSIAPAGLWGAPPQAIGTERDTGAKRRWTLAQTA